MVRDDRKRNHAEAASSSSSSKIEASKKHNSSSASTINTNPHHTSQGQQLGKPSNFISYLEVPNLPPKVKLLCEILAKSPSPTVEKYLEDTGIRVSREDAEEVLKLSYGFPAQAVKFFRWSGFQLHNNHSPYAWNLVVDMLGKNKSFDAMWDAIKSMRKERMLSLATFASVFSSYVIANRVQEAIMTFEVMDEYGCPKDIVALNSLLSAICREGKTKEAKDFLFVVKNRIRPDDDTYAILLEGCETEGDVSGARQAFSEMVIDMGWNPRNVPAYDSFLTTVLKGPEGMGEVLKYFVTMRDRGCYPGMKFFKAALQECVRKNDVRNAELIWKEMTWGNGCVRDSEMYNSFIALYCNLKEYELALNLLDDMSYSGVFPNSETYNVLFHFLVKSKRLKEASVVFSEMVKNECVPSHSNCSLAVETYVYGGDPYMAIKVWKCMVENYNSDLEETGNLLILGLRSVNRLPEAVKYAEDIIDRGIKLNSSTLSKLKQSLTRAGKGLVYDELMKKWKAR